MKKRTFIKTGLAAGLTIGGIGTSLFARNTPAFPTRYSTTDSQETTLAFAGDHGAGRDAWKVFELIKREGADLLVSQGDFGYDKTAEEFNSVLNATLGPDFPIIATLGNRDLIEQLQYQKLFAQRLVRTPEVTCDGEVGIRFVARFRGIDIVSATPGLPSWHWPGHNNRFLEKVLSSSRSRWKICNWHMNQTAVQLGKKGNTTGWGVYETSRKHGALIVNGHEHSYSRTLPITKMADQPKYIASDSNVAQLRPGQTVVIVSGLGGQSIRPQLRTDPWFAAAYTSNHRAKSGALFCTFKAGGASDHAHCRFVNVDGEVIDHFRLETGVAQGV